MKTTSLRSWDEERPKQAVVDMFSSLTVFHQRLKDNKIQDGIYSQEMPYIIEPATLDAITANYQSRGLWDETEMIKANKRSKRRMKLYTWKEC